MPSNAFMAAVRHHQAGQLAEADRLYAQVLAAEPDHAHALHLRGALAHAAGRNEDAVELIGRAIALDGKLPDFHYNIGLALWALGRRAEAIRHWARALALNPNFGQARLNLGNALREEGRIADAIASICAAAAAAAPVARSRTTPSGSRWREPDGDEEAMPAFRRAIALQPALIDAYLNLATSHCQPRTDRRCARASQSAASRFGRRPTTRRCSHGLSSGLQLDRDIRATAPPPGARDGRRLGARRAISRRRDRAHPHGPARDSSTRRAGLADPAARKRVQRARACCAARSAPEALMQSAVVRRRDAGAVSGGLPLCLARSRRSRAIRRAR